MGTEAPVREAILATLPHLRAFAISLSGKVDRADDLVQETLLRALTNINSFEPGTNLLAWLFTILRTSSGPNTASGAVRLKTSTAALPKT